MKKKFLVVMLAVCLALGMSGCGSGERAKKMI